MVAISRLGQGQYIMTDVAQLIKGGEGGEAVV